MVVVVVVVAVAGYFVFDLMPYMTLLAVPLSCLLSMIAVRCATSPCPLCGLTFLVRSCSGETDINPIGGMGKVTQLIFAGVAPGNLVTNLMTAAITAGVFLSFSLSVVVLLFRIADTGRHSGSVAVRRHDARFEKWLSAADVPAQDLHRTAHRHHGRRGGLRAPVQAVRLGIRNWWV
jgi:hypothetical protein